MHLSIWKGESKVKRVMELMLMNGKKNGSGKKKRPKAPSLSWRARESESISNSRVKNGKMGQISDKEQD